MHIEDTYPMKDKIVILHRINSARPDVAYWASPSPDQFDRGEDGYFAVRNAVWQFLIDNHVCSLPIDLDTLFARNGYNLLTFSTARNFLSDVIGEQYFDGSLDCFTIFCNDSITVVYDETLPHTRLRFSLAHELGHIVLSHDLHTPFRYDVEADLFASRLLMPACVINACKVDSADELALLCEVSLAAARSRFARIQRLAERNRYLQSETERKVLKGFSDFVQGYLELNHRV